MKIATSAEYLDALLQAPRPGSEKILAFYDSRADLICRDPSLLLLPLDDHMCHRGDGLFESMALRDNRIFALGAHLSRLAAGAAALGLTPPVPFERMGELIKAVARAGGSANGDLRVFLGRGPGGFGVSPAECPKASLYVVAIKADPPKAELYERGLAAFASAVPPKQDYLATIKNTNYLPNVLMAHEAAQKGLDVAITFDAAGNMGEAAIANIGIVDASGALACPPLDRVLSGTTLLAALELARAKMPVRLGSIHRDEIFSAREMLLFTSASLCVPITSFDGKPIATGAPGPVGRWLKDALLEKMMAEGEPVQGAGR